MHQSLEQLLTSSQFTRTQQCAQQLDLSDLDLSGVNLAEAKGVQNHA